MNTKILFYLPLLAATMSGVTFASEDVFKAGSPAEYPSVADVQSLSRFVKHLKSLAAQGKLDQEAILRANAHGALMIHDSQRGSNRNPVPLANNASQPSAAGDFVPDHIGGVRFAGSDGIDLYIEVYGQLSGARMVMDCGDGPTPIGSGYAYVSVPQINIQIPHEFYRAENRECKIFVAIEYNSLTGKYHGGSNPAYFTLPGIGPAH